MNQSTSGEICVKPGEITEHELLGLTAEVVVSTNPCMVGIQGKIVNETHNMLVLDAGKEKRVPKSECTFDFMFSDERKIRVDGIRLVGRPEDRIQKRRKRRG